jgi:hypothetical protein
MEMADSLTQFGGYLRLLVTPHPVRRLASQHYSRAANRFKAAISAVKWGGFERRHNDT